MSRSTRNSCRLTLQQSENASFLGLFPNVRYVCSAGELYDFRAVLVEARNNELHFKSPLRNIETVRLIGRLHEPSRVLHHHEAP